jgi:ferrochelatase
MSRIGVLLLNIGTPDAPDVKSVRRYLREFLSDPRVVDLPAWQRWILLNLFILPFRPKRSAAAYQQIWTDTGSPLLNYSKQLREKLAHELGEQYVVTLGMRYGQPSIATAIKYLQQQQCQKLLLLPLFPQYSVAATGSALAAALTCLQQQNYHPEVVVKDAFYAEQEYIQSLAAIITENLADFSADYLLFSFHGIPQRQLQHNCFTVVCDHCHACPTIDKNNAFCYRAQCYATTRLVAETMKLEEKKYGVAFQSRLGRAAWIQPYTTVSLTQLAQQGVKKLAVVCPSFVLDCLETLEEIGIRAREQWLALGGEMFKLIPALNVEPQWIKTLVRYIKKQ